MLVKQLSRLNDPNAIHVEPRPYTIKSGTPSSVPQSSNNKATDNQTATSATEDSSSPGNFIDRLWPHAAAVAKDIGVAPHLLLGQAALESGWGKQAPRLPDGSSSHNLFNIKAGSSWKGRVVQTETTEYVNGVTQKSTAKFRAYDSDAEAFSDYAGLLKGNSRYAGVLQAGSDAQGFAQGLQSGGYATDPMYGVKLVRLINSNSFRTALLGDQAPAN
jgi:flagellar protein FlgJ